MATIIGISGPSSSGKTTLTRLLQRIFNSSSPSAGAGAGAKDDAEDNANLRTFIIHEDDFYFPDDQIPTTTLPTGKTIQDWDCSSAIDIPFLTASLSYVRANGSLPPRLRSKEDQNEATESGVSEEVVTQLRKDVQTRLSSSIGGRKRGHSGTGEVVVAFLEGFLLYAPPHPVSSPPQEEREGHALRDVHALIDLRLFLPAPYDLVKRRRENRSGYVTIGPAPTPTPTPTPKEEEGSTEEKGEVDLEGEDDRPPQNFWTDPPGYVDDIVWPRYVQDHAWLLLPEGESESGQRSADCLGAGPQDVVKLVGQGVNVRADAGVTVAPGQGNLPMVDILQWAVEEVMKHLEQVAY